MGLLLKLLLLGGILGSVWLLFLQNSQALSLVVLGFYRTPELALGMWIILFTLAGVVTSFSWQLLRHTPKSTKQKVKKQIPKPTDYRPNSEWKGENKPTDWANLPQTASEWEGENKPTDWGGIPPQTAEEPWETIPPPPPETPPEKPPESTTTIPPQTPEPKLDTTYSFSYVKSPPKQNQNNRDQVYDAPYRILNSPPVVEDNKEEEDDEDWV